MEFAHIDLAAIDIGYGNCKVLADGHTTVHHFPSLAAPAADADLGGGVLAARATYRVSVGKLQYEVGRDAALVARSASKILNDAYTDTDQYRALFHACLLSLNVESIGDLTTGLPVSLFTTRRDRLVAMMEGTHQVNEDRHVRVRSVRCVPQPLGAYMRYIHDRRAEQFVRQMNCLVIDVGHYSVDWLVVNRFTPDIQRSGSHFSGVFALIKAIQAEIAGLPQWGVEPHYMDIDRALRDGSNHLSLFGRNVDLVPILAESTVTSAGQALSELRNQVGDGRDIDRIVVAGGGASLYAGTVKSTFPRHTVEVLDGSVGANVEGYLRLARLLLQRSAA